jgi:hypothetical protein
MPRKIDTPIIIARYGDKVAGWAGDENGGRLTGDKEWIETARAASDARLEYTLYSGLTVTADITDPNNPAGAFAALAWYPKERILIKTAPEGMMESLGLLNTPETVDYFDDYDGEVSEEDKEFIATHVSLTVDGEDIWVPLAKLKDNSSSPAVISTFLAKLAQEDESDDEIDEGIPAEDTETPEEVEQQEDASQDKELAPAE